MLVNSSCIIKHLICMHEEPMQFEIDVLKLIYSHEYDIEHDVLHKLRKYK